MRLEVPPLRATSPARITGSDGAADISTRLPTIPPKSAGQPARSVSVELGPAMPAETFDTARVEAIRAAIAGGTYPLDAQRTAVALMAGGRLTDARS